MVKYPQIWMRILEMGFDSPAPCFQELGLW